MDHQRETVHLRQLTGICEGDSTADQVLLLQLTSGFCCSVTSQWCRRVVEVLTSATHQEVQPHLLLLHHLQPATCLLWSTQRHSRSKDTKLTPDGLTTVGGTETCTFTSCCGEPLHELCLQSDKVLQTVFTVCFADM